MGKYTEADLESVIEQTIDDVSQDSEMCGLYPKICAFATSEEYKIKLIDKIKKVALESKKTDLYEVMGLVENELDDFQGDE